MIRPVRSTVNLMFPIRLASKHINAYMYKYVYVDNKLRDDIYQRFKHYMFSTAPAPTPNEPPNFFFSYVRPRAQECTRKRWCRWLRRRRRELLARSPIAESSSAEHETSVKYVGKTRRAERHTVRNAREVQP